MKNFKVTLTIVNRDYEWDSPEFSKTETLAILPSRTEATGMKYFCDNTFTDDDYWHFVEEIDEPVTHQRALEWATTYEPISYKDKEEIKQSIRYAILDALNEEIEILITQGFEQLPENALLTNRQDVNAAIVNSWSK